MQNILFLRANLNSFQNKADTIYEIDSYEIFLTQILILVAMIANEPHPN